MATTCPNCGHRWIQRRFKSSPRIKAVETVDLKLISDENGIIVADLILKHFTKWSKETVWDVAASMVRNGVWVKLPGKPGRYLKIRDYIKEPRGQLGKSDKKERMKLRHT